jgi:hypothetical protein
VLLKLWTNSLYSTWDNQFYPMGIPGAEVMTKANASGGRRAIATGDPHSADRI